MTRFLFRSIFYSILLTSLLFYFLIQYLQAVSDQTQKHTNATEPNPSETSSDMIIHFINLEIGKTILIQLGERGILIDVGHREDTKDLLFYLKEAKINEVSDIFLSSAIEENSGGLPSILKEFPYANVYAPKLTINQYPVSLRKSFKMIVPGDVIDLSMPNKISLEVLGPIPPAFHDRNEDSLVSLIRYQEIRILLTGDIHERAEARLLKSFPNLKAEIMTVPDRPTGVTNSQDFIKRINPQTAVMLEVPCVGCNEVIDKAKESYSLEWSDFFYVSIGERFLIYFKDGSYTTPKDQYK